MITQHYCRQKRLYNLMGGLTISIFPFASYASQDERSAPVGLDDEASGKMKIAVTILVHIYFSMYLTTPSFGFLQHHESILTSEHASAEDVILAVENLTAARNLKPQEKFEKCLPLIAEQLRSKDNNVRQNVAECLSCVSSKLDPIENQVVAALSRGIGVNRAYHEYTMLMDERASLLKIVSERKWSSSVPVLLNLLDELSANKNSRPIYDNVFVLAIRALGNVEFQDAEIKLQTASKIHKLLEKFHKEDQGDFHKLNHYRYLDAIFFAAANLENAGKENMRFVQMFLEKNRDKDGDYVLSAAYALQKLDPTSKIGLTILIERVQTGQRSAISRLTDLGHLAEEAIPVLIGRLEICDRSRITEIVQLIEAIAAIAPNEPSVRDVITGFTSHKFKEIRNAAKKADQQIKKQEDI